MIQIGATVLADVDIAMMTPMGVRARLGTGVDDADGALVLGRSLASSVGTGNEGSSAPTTTVSSS